MDIFNLNKNVVADVVRAVIDNDGYCPCQIEKEESSKCKPVNSGAIHEVIQEDALCQNGMEKGKCHCKLYIKEEVKPKDDFYLYIDRENPDTMQETSYKYESMDELLEFLKSQNVSNRFVVIGRKGDIDD